MSLLVLSILAGVIAAPPDTTVPDLPGLGTHHRQITTRAPRAQQSFDQGLRLLFAFNHAEAERAFRAALAHDSTAAMAWWGLALGSSPYLDRGRQPALDAVARDHATRARRLATGVSAVERDLIESLFARFGDSTMAPAVADSGYSRRLATLHQKYPADADIAALYGESVMLLSRRSYWNGNTLKPGMEAARSALEAAFKVDSLHPFANHLYVHFFEAAHDPGPAVPAAERLQTIAPGAGHMLHMSSHIFARVGRYEEAAEANRRAWQADRVYFELARPEPTSTYASGYHLHTLHFLWSVLAMQGKQDEARVAAESLAAKVNPAGLNRSIYQQSWASAALMVALRFEDWERIRRMAAPPDSQLYASLLWHHGRGMAAAARGEVALAEQHLGEVESRVASLPPNATVAPTSRAAPLARIALLMTRARIAEAMGNADSSLALLRLAAAVQDSLGHMEPPPWYLPLRHSLGAALIRAARPAEAERVFLEDLEVNPRNPWAEMGLARARLMQDSTRGVRVERLADGVYAVIRREPPGLINESNSLLIVGDGGVIVVDAQSSVSRTRETLAALRRITTEPVRAVVNTHWHDDHVFGNGVYRDSFPGVQFIAHAASAEDLAATGLASRADAEANREGTIGFLRDLVSKDQSFAGGPLGEEERLSHLSSADLMADYGQTPPGYVPQAPTTLVRDSLILRQGNRVIRVLYLGRGHSRGDLVVFLPAEGILAAGDLVMSPVQFVGTTSFPADFAESVDRLVALGPSKVVPGHGPVLQGTEHARLISRMLHSLTEQVRAAAARGETVEQVRKSVNLDEFRRAFAGDSELRRILFSYYVLTPAVQRAYELNAAR